MTHPDRAIKAGARAAEAAQLKWKSENGGDNASCIDCPDEITSAVVITAYREYLAAEGFVVVPVEPTVAMHAAWMCDHRDWPARYRALITAAQQEQNAPAPPKTGGE